MRLALLVLLAIVVAVWAAWSRGAQRVGPVGALQPVDQGLTESRVVYDDGVELARPESRLAPATRGSAAIRSEVGAPREAEPALPRAELRAQDKPAVAPRPVDLLTGDVRFEVVVAVSAFNLSPVGDMTPAWVSVEFSGSEATATGGVMPGERAAFTSAAARAPDGELRLPNSLHLVIDHIEAARFEAEVPISSPSSYVDADDGTLVCRWYTSAQLAPIHARLIGRAEASLVALVAHSDLREPGPLTLTDLARVSGGEYSLRAPAAGDWVVIALEPERHPHFAIATVPRVVERVDVGARLRPFVTELQVIGRMPAGYTPNGESVEVVTPWFVKDEQGRESVKRRGPLLTWHTGVAGAAPLGGFGVDLRREEPESIGDGAIVWLRSRATWNASGEARVRGAPTGNVIVRVERPLLPGQFELVQASTSAGVMSVDLAVSRIDIVGQSRGGPLAGGAVQVEALPPRGRGAVRGLGGEGATNAMQWSATLDAAGVGVLFVPSDVPLVVSLRNPEGGAVVERPAIAYGRGAQSTLVIEVEPR